MWMFVVRLFHNFKNSPQQVESIVRGAMMMSFVCYNSYNHYICAVLKHHLSITLKCCFSGTAIVVSAQRSYFQTTQACSHLCVTFGFNLTFYRLLILAPPFMEITSVLVAFVHIPVSKKSKRTFRYPRSRTVLLQGRCEDKKISNLDA
jgi:hypothetical protein